MFFLASKLLEFALMPLVWVVLALGWALWRRSRRWVWAALGLLFFFGNEGIVNRVLLAWEPPAVPLAALHRPYPCAVVLGGFTHVGRYPADRVYTNQAADRLLHAILLYRQGLARRILISGGSGYVLPQPDREAHNAARLALLCAVPHAALLQEPRARNTRENATLSRQMLDSAGIRDTVLVVTSAFHARRAAGCFARVGVPFRLFPTDHRGQPPRLTPDVWLIPNATALAKWDMLIHEWVGLGMYWAAGYV